MEGNMSKIEKIDGILEITSEYEYEGTSVYKINFNKGNEIVGFEYTFNDEIQERLEPEEDVFDMEVSSAISHTNSLIQNLLDFAKNNVDFYEKYKEKIDRISSNEEERNSKEQQTQRVKEFIGNGGNPDILN